MLTKERGDIATGKAIGYFLSNSYEVCLPIGDKRDYDLIIEKTGLLQRVQVKYAGFYPSKNNECRAGLRITGGNRSRHASKKYDANAFELLFVYTAKDSIFLIPWPDLLIRSELHIENAKYLKYLVQG